MHKTYFLKVTYAVENKHENCADTRIQVYECGDETAVWRRYGRLKKGQSEGLIGDVEVELILGRKVTMDPEMRTLTDGRGLTRSAEYCGNRNGEWGCIKPAGHDGQHKHVWDPKPWGPK